MEPRKVYEGLTPKQYAAKNAARTRWNEANPETVWNLYECDNGARWSSTVKWDSQTNEQREGECGFSGCPRGHRFRIVGNSSEREKVSEWFLRPVSA